MLKGDAAARAAAKSSRVVTPEVHTIIPESLAGGTREPAGLNRLHVLSINKRVDVPLGRTFRINRESVNVNMLCCLKFYGRSTGVCAIGCKCQVAVTSSVQELSALIVVEHTQADVFVRMNFTDVE